MENYNLLEKFKNKINQEYDIFIENIKKLSKEEIIDKSGYIATMRDIYDTFMNKEEVDKYALKLILEQNNSLYFIYDIWNDSGNYEEYEYDYIYTLENEIDDYKRNLKDIIKENPNYDLIKDISHILEELDSKNLCEKLKEKFYIEDLDEVDVYDLLNSKDGVNYLYYYFNDLKNSKELNDLIDTSNIDNLSKNILPKLKSLYLEKNNIKPDKIKYQESER